MTVAAGQAVCAGLRSSLRPNRMAADRVPLVDHAHRDQGERRAGKAVEPEVVAGRHHGEPDPGGPDDPERLRPPVLRDPREDDADDQRVAGVQARHGRVRVGGELDDPVGVVVREPDAEQPGRRHRQEHVSEEPEQVREQDRVAELDEVLVPADVNPEQGEADDRELASSSTSTRPLPPASAAGRRTART